MVVCLFVRCNTFFDFDLNKNMRQFGVAHENPLLPGIWKKKKHSPSIILISNYFVSFQCFHNMSKQLLAPGGLTAACAESVHVIIM